MLENIESVTKNRKFLYNFLFIIQNPMRKPQRSNKEKPGSKITKHTPIKSDYRHFKAKYSRTHKTAKM